MSRCRSLASRVSIRLMPRCSIELTNFSQALSTRSARSEFVMRGPPPLPLASRMRRRTSCRDDTPCAMKKALMTTTAKSSTSMIRRSCGLWATRSIIPLYLQVDHAPDHKKSGQVENAEAREPGQEHRVIRDIQEEARVQREQQHEGEDREDRQHHRRHAPLARQRAHLHHHRVTIADHLR